MIAVGALLIEADVMEPRGVDGAHAALLNISEREKVASDMVEYAVQNDADPFLVQGIADTLKAFVIAQTAVDLFVVDGIVTVAAALKNRVEYNTVHAHFLEMGDKVVELIQAVIQLKIILFRRSAEAERIDVINDGVMDPMHENTSL